MIHITPFASHVKTNRRTKILSIISLLILAIVIPLTVIVSQQEQELRQRAEEVSTLTLRGGKQGYVPGSVVIRYKNSRAVTSVTTQSNIEKRLRKKKGKIKRRHPEIQVDVAEVPIGEEQSVINDLKTDSDVAFAERNAYVTASLVPNDPDFSKQYAFRKSGAGKSSINAEKAWDVSQGEGVLVAVLDTGIDSSHPDLSSKIEKNKRFSHSDTNDDLFGHGTHVAGIIAARTNNNVGVAGGCPKCRLLNVKVLDDDRTGEQVDVAAGIDWAVKNHAKIINLSVSGNLSTDVLKEAIDNAWKNGVLIVAAAGNNGKNKETFPASYDHVIGVAALNQSGKKADYSNFGLWVDVAAPGSHIFSTSPTGTNRSGMAKSYDYLNGTSMASPMVAATAALIWAKNPNLTNSEVRKRIENTASDIDGTGSNWKFGLVNAASALGGNDQDEEEPTVTSGPRPTAGDEEDTDPCPNNDEKDDKKDKKRKKGNNKKDDKKNEENCEPVSDGTTVALNVFLHGIGRGGDNANPNAAGTSNPVTPERDVTVEIYDSNNTLITTAEGTITYDKTKGTFTGMVAVDGPPSGTYIVIVRSPTYLGRRVGNIVNLTKGQENKIPDIKLITGDANYDNQLNILDFNVLNSCLDVDSESQETINGLCTKQDAINSDLDDNGLVDLADRGLLLRELSARPGS